ncbi:MAG: hypothetical protein ACODAJ_00155 [Planctomycetota bacterium]
MSRAIPWLVATVCVCAVAVGGERGAASFIPADCWLTVHYDGGHPGFKETPLHRFFQEAEVQAAVAQLQPLWDYIKTEVEKEGDREGAALLRHAVGCEILLGVSQVGEGNESHVVVAVGLPEDDPAVRQLLEKLVQDELDEAKEGSVKHLEIGGLKGTTFIDDKGEPGGFAFADRVHILSDDETLFRKALDPAIPKLAARLGEERPVLRVRYDHQAMLEQHGDRIDANTRTTLTALGLDAARSAEILLVPRAKRLAMEMQVDMPGAREAGGLTKWLADAPPVDRALLKHVPRDSVLFWAASWDGAALWDAIWEVVARTTADQGEAARRELGEMEAKIGLEIREAFLAPLDRGTVAVAMPGGGLIGGSGVVIQRVEDPQKLEASLGQLVNRLDLLLADMGRGAQGVRTQLKPFDYRGHTCRYLWLMGTPALMFAGWAPCYTVLDDLVVFARHPLDLKDYLDFVEDGGPTVAENAEFQRLLADVPKGASVVSYANWSDQVVGLYNTAAPLIQILQGFQEEMNLPQPLDVANLPSSRLLRRYAKGTVAYTVYDGGRYRAVLEGDGMVLLSPHMGPVAGGAIAAGMLLPALARARGEARLIRDRNNLNVLGRACATYLNEHGDNRRYPASLGELIDKGIIADRTVLVSPLDEDPPKLANGVPCSYVSCFDKYPQRQFLDDFPPNVMMAWDREAFVPGRRNVLFFDTHVEAVDEARFQELLEQLDERVKEHTKKRQPKTDF